MAYFAPKSNYKFNPGDKGTDTSQQSMCRTLPFASGILLGLPAMPNINAGYDHSDGKVTQK